MDFERAEWQAMRPGARRQTVERDGKRFRLVEFTRELVEHNWCDKVRAGDQMTSLVPSRA